MIPAPFAAAATTGVAFIDDRLTLKETFGRDNQFRVGLTDLVRDDPIFGIFFLAEAITLKPIAAISGTACTADIEIRVIGNPFHTCTVLITVDELKVIS
jgi:hypothetical protein